MLDALQSIADFSAFLKGEESDARDDDMPDSAFDVLQALRTGETDRCDAVSMNEKKTTPPRYLSKQCYWRGAFPRPTEVSNISRYDCALVSTTKRY